MLPGQLAWLIKTFCSIKFKETEVKANPNRTRMEANHKKQVFKLTNGKSKGKLADHSSKSRLEKLIPSRVPYPKPWLEILIRRPAKLFWLEESVSLPKYQLSFRLSALFLLTRILQWKRSI